jgi:predicted transcriptional regulator of viral defense system
MPTYCVDNRLRTAHNVGMINEIADTSRGRNQAIDLSKRLDAANSGALFRPNQMESFGLSRFQLPSLIRIGKVERVGRGLYRRTDAEPTEDYSLAMASVRVPNSIICLLSALRVHGIGTQSSAVVWLAIPHKARLPRFPELKLRIVRFSRSAWTFGVKETTFEGVRARITSPARTIVDCFRFERLVGAETAREALQDALRQHKVTIAELARIQEVLPSRRLRAALDMRLT